ncbi:gamma tubulin complex linker, pericentrin/kendrin Pcp1 [Schizosaccharomyces osmophilus]|uniref:Gamma tubulin complex linker, pericentrin/kendrin Pcp1 n=1 Tax=Schizosaccharomyces osmophilus TaxID=2545709 RepID=A0AAE9WAU7_9SCHI|nr:gamma tubulin complex linker, pericentrin/kendrin Pcp1 [Schizosaccharomyces osmophilus]WBW72568.1 gamma tubulin complex linker, pericentrin/kendrin Pcp1 [Schizosaccharomyces osmophilus]
MVQSATPKDETPDDVSKGNFLNSFKRTMNFDKPSTDERDSFARTPSQGFSNKQANPLEFTPLLNSVRQNSSNQISSLDEKSPYRRDFSILSPVSEKASQEGISIDQKSDAYDISKLDESSFISNAEGTNDDLPANAALTLREQEKILENVGRENFGLRVKIAYLNKRLDSMAPEQIREAVNDNVDLHVERTKLLLQLKKSEQLLTKSHSENDDLVKKIQFLEKVNSVEQSQNIKVFMERIRSLEAECSHLKAQQAKSSPPLNENENQIDMEYDMRRLQDRYDEINEELIVAQDMLNEKDGEISLLKQQPQEPPSRDHSHSRNKEDNSHVQLLMDFEALEKKYVDLQDELAHVRDELQQKNNELDYTQDISEVQTLKEKLHEAELHIKYLNNQIHDFEDMSNELEDLTNHVENMENERDKLLVKIKSLESTNGDLREVATSLGNQLESFRSKNMSLEEKNKMLELMSQSNDTENVLRELNIRLETITAEMTDLRMRYESNLADLETLKKDKRSLQFENDRHRMDMEVTVAQLNQDIELERAKYTQMTENLTRTRKSLEEQNSSLETALQSKEKNMFLFEEQIRNLRASEQELLTRLHSGQETISNLQRKLNKHELEKEELIQKLRERVSTSPSKSSNLIDNMNDELSVLRREISDLKDELELSEQDREEALAAQAKLTSQVDQLSKERQNMMLDYTKLKEELLQTQGQLRRKELEVTDLNLKLSERRTAVTNIGEFEKQRKKLDLFAEDIRRLEADKMNIEKVAYQLSTAIQESEVNKNSFKERFCAFLLERPSTTTFDEVVNQIEDLIRSQKQKIQELQAEIDKLTYENLNSQFGGNFGLSEPEKLGLSPIDKHRVQKMLDDYRERLHKEVESKYSLKNELQTLKKDSKSYFEKAKLLEKEKYYMESELKKVKISGNYDGTHDEEKRLLHQKVKDLEKEGRIYAQHWTEKENLTSADVVKGDRPTLDSLKDALWKKTTRMEQLKSLYDNLKSEYHILLKSNRTEYPRYFNDSDKLSAGSQNLRTRHSSEVRGLIKMTQFLQSKFEREHTLRLDLAFSKKFILLQLTGYETCNKLNLRLLQKIGITPDNAVRKKRLTFKSVTILICSVQRMKRMSYDWQKQLEVRQSLQRAAEKARLEAKKIDV